ncbi:G-protein coupled receptor Mth2-like [Anticarsia gemmatalis]|uniref:G-protein coupled receptor Mth2-like n=1 Tax=Anticarsia gemmatalis TaxID=129554 RepID=UPI003F76AE0C
MLRIACLIFVALSAVDGYDIADSNWKDLKGNPISRSYCKNKNCLVKCCPDGYMVVAKDNVPQCIRPGVERLQDKLSEEVNVYKWDDKLKTPVDTGKTVNSHFEFVQNDYLMDLTKTIPFTVCDFKILEDGSLKVKKTKEDMPCYDTSPLQYCVSYVFILRDPKEGEGTGPVRDAVFSFRGLREDDPDAKKKHDFAAIGMLISSFFMALVLVVYASLRQLRNIVGMILMAYMFTLSVAFVLQSAQLIALVQSNIDSKTCQLLSPATYYFLVASFFWLNVMSFDLWWTIRGTRKRRDIHRRGELVKFGWYGLYAWGVPALLTMAVVIVDRNQLYGDENDRPPFRSCSAENRATVLYTHIPIGIMTAANIVFFILTAYNIWLVKSAVHKSKDSRNTKPSENRFVIYIKVFLLMGGSWILELMPSDQVFWLHVLINFYNMFVGVAIFIMFVCRKSILIMLCKKFNIRNSYVDRMQSSQYSRSGTTKSSISKNNNRKSMRDDYEAAEELTTYSTTADAA